MQRLIMVVSSAWSWPDHADTVARHAERLAALLVPGVPGGHAAFARLTPAPVAGDRLDGAQPETARVFWRSGAAGQRLIHGLSDRIACGAGRPAGEPLPAVQHRIYLNAEQLRHVVPGVPDDAVGTGVHVVLDFTFTRRLMETLTCVLSVSVWHGHPLHGAHRPPAAPARDPRVIRSVREHEGLFTEICAAVEGWFAAPSGPVTLDRAEYQVSRRIYHLPKVWVVVPQRLQPDAARYLKERDRKLINSLADMALGVGDARDTVLAGGVLNGEVLALRRFMPVADDRSVPCYLLIPDRPERTEEAVHQELMIGEVVQLLIELEASIARRLYEIRSDLEIWANHLDVYDVVADEALVLWDAVVTHLPVRRWFRLGRLHRSVELLHQTLLQGTADLAYLVTKTDFALAAIESATQSLLDQYDAELTEYPLQDGRRSYPGIGTALVREGVMGAARAEGHRVRAQADRVQAKYRDLLATISSAFDERRVRESDALQKASAIMGLGLAVIGVVTVLDATVTMKPATGSSLLFKPGWVATTAAVISIVLGTGFALVAMSVFGAMTRFGRLGSRWFRQRYNGTRWRRGRSDGLWSFLKDSSTDSLGRVAGSDWVAYDADLAHRFARLWDDALEAGLRPAGPEYRSDVVRHDIRLLARRVEQWSLQTLLITERPWKLYLHGLARLTLLYRACTLLPGSFLAPESRGAGEPDKNVVSPHDLVRSLRRSGFTVAEAEEIDAELRARVRALEPGRPAGVVLRVLDGWGIRAVLSRDEVAEVMGRVRETPTPAPSAARASG